MLYLGSRSECTIEKREYIESFGENKGDEECDKCKGHLLHVWSIRLWLYKRGHLERTGLYV